VAAIGSPTPIIAANINNFTGELFKITPHRTPLLSASGGLTGGKAINSTYFQFQTVDNAVVSSVTPGSEGGAPNFNGRSRSAVQGVLEIFHEAVQITFTAQAAYGEIVPFDLASSYKNSIDKLALEGTNPVNDEMAAQLELVLELVAKKAEFQAFNGAFSDGTSSTRQMRGLDEHCSLSGGNIYYNDANGDGSGADQKIHWDTVAGAMKKLYDAGAPLREPVLFISPQMLLDLNKELVNPTVSGALTGGILPRDRNVGGVDIDTIVTPFGAMGLALSDYLPSNKAFIVDMAFVTPVFLNVPGKGTVFIRDLDQGDNARMGKAVYMEMGYDFGPPQYHCEIADIA
tara:strand:+ start:943 stop:1974 length:1032 start_codon:yes stop_codon:yes gene_type:complete